MTKPIYEAITDENKNTIIKRTNADGTISWIPTNPANSDYQEYLNPSEAKTK